MVCSLGCGVTVSKISFLKYYAADLLWGARWLCLPQIDVGARQSVGRVGSHHAAPHHPQQTGKQPQHRCIDPNVVDEKTLLIKFYE